MAPNELAALAILVMAGFWLATWFNQPRFPEDFS